MIRVAIFTDTDLRVPGDLSSALKAVLRHPAPDMTARIFTATDPPADTSEYFAASSVGMALPWDPNQRVCWPRIGAFAKQLRATGVRVIHVATPGPVGVAGRWLAHRLQLPVVGSIHRAVASGGTALPESRAAIADRLFRWTYGGCQSLLAPSRASLAGLSKRGLTSARVWPAGVDTSRFSPARASSTLREAWHVDDRRPAILVPLRGMTRADATLLEPLRRSLHRHAVAHQFVFVDANRTGLDLSAVCPDGVVLGDLADDDRAIVMASTDVCLFAGADDSAAGSVIEAQACGLPALVPDAGAAPEAIVAGTTGRLFAPRSADDAVAKLIDLLRHARVREAMGRAARGHAIERQWPAMLGPVHEAWRAAADDRITGHEAA